MERFFGDHPVIHAGLRDAAALALIAPILLIGHVDHHPGLGCVVEAMRSFLLPSRSSCP